MMRRVWFWCASSLLLALPASAATILERRLEVHIAADGVVREHQLLRVRLDHASDLESWTNYPIYLDDNRQLESVEAFSTNAHGKRVEVRRRDRDRIELSSSGILHSSQQFEVLSFRSLAPGSVVQIDTRVVVEPYFPSGGDVVRLSEPTQHLHLEIRYDGPPEQLRWSLEEVDTEGLEISEQSGRLLIVGHDLEAAAGDLLRFAWDRSGTWAEVERWYQALVADTEPADAALKTQARQLIAGHDSSRQQLEALVAFVRRQVRYVAVEVGVGGFRPSPSGEVLERRWGDCKDKSMLLIDLLAEAGIAAYPALIRGSYREDIDPDFPSPDQFNHLIVALDASAVDSQAEDPVAEGLLFIDPTQTRGNAGWLAPWVQAQHALVIGDGNNGLVRTPLRPAQESRRLELDLSLDEGGDASGDLQLILVGRVASALTQAIEEQPPLKANEPLRTLLDNLLPGSQPTQLSWRQLDGPAPTVEVQAAVRFTDLVQGAANARPSLRLPGPAHLPAPRELDELDQDLSLLAGSHQARWRLRLPAAWCPPAAANEEVSEAVAQSRQILSHDEEGRWLIERHTALHRRWFEAEAIELLRKVALHEHRLLRRRFRLHCKSPSG